MYQQVKCNGNAEIAQKMTQCLKPVQDKTGRQRQRMLEKLPKKSFIYYLLFMTFPKQHSIKRLKLKHPKTLRGPTRPSLTVLGIFKKYNT